MIHLNLPICFKKQLQSTIPNQQGPTGFRVPSPQKTAIVEMYLDPQQQNPPRNPAMAQDPSCHPPESPVAEGRKGCKATTFEEIGVGQEKVA